MTSALVAKAAGADRLKIDTGKRSQAAIAAGTGTTDMHGHQLTLIDRLAVQIRADMRSGSHWSRAAGSWPGSDGSTVGRVTGSTAGRAAVLAPGARYSTDGPLLMYPGLAVERRGGYTHRLSWVVPEFASDELERAWVIAQVTAAINATVAAAGVAAPVVIGKSLASLSAPVVADRGLPAIWLTPVLTDEPTVSALRAARGPCLLVGGTSDQSWDGGTARLVTPHVLEVEDADHGMLIPGALSASAAVLGQVITAVEEFLDRVVWRH